MRMKDIEIVSDSIECKLDKAEDDIKNALMFKEKRGSLADVYYRMANEDMEHVNMLHTQVIAIINEYKQSGKTIPEGMQTLYDILHRKHIEHAAIIKSMITLYKE